MLQADTEQKTEGLYGQNTKRCKNLKMELIASMSLVQPDKGWLKETLPRRQDARHR